MPRDHLSYTCQDVTDISSADQLLRYAAAAQLQPLLAEQGFTQEWIAVGAGLATMPRNAGPILTKALNGSESLTTSQLHGLDQIIGALTLNRNSTGSLSSLALRLRAGQHGRTGVGRRGKAKESTLEAQVPPGWTRTILADPPADEIGVLMQASALLSELMAADKMNTPGAVAALRNHYGKEMELLARRLILISFAPPTSRSYDAQVLLGLLAVYAFDEIKDHLHDALRDSPMGFRVWPAITKLVTLSSDGGRHDRLRAWVRGLIRDAETLRDKSLYGGNSYDLELALAVPAAWSPPDDDWVGGALLARAWDNEATIRERGTAAMGLWQRAFSQERPDPESTEDDLRALIAEFRKEPSARPDAAAGLRWLAATLEHVIDNRVAVCNDWPDVGEPWFRRVQDAATRLEGSGIPDHLRTGTKNLFLHVILQNAGVYRRWAIETVVTSGMSQQVAQALASLLGAETKETWLRVRAQAALGFMQRFDAAGQTDLTHACLQACENLGDDKVPTRAQVTEVVAALFAVGDCFGASGLEERAGRARDDLRSVLIKLVDSRGALAETLQRAVRAAAYLLAVTAQPGKNDLSRVQLQRLAGHPDPVTSKFSNWILSFRFTADGRIRPLIAAADPAHSGGTPY
jgi:hypothetical protein